MRSRLYEPIRCLAGDYGVHSVIYWLDMVSTPAQHPRTRIKPAHQLTSSPAHQLTSSPAHQLTSSPAHQLTSSPAHQFTHAPQWCIDQRTSPPCCSAAPVHQTGAYAPCQCANAPVWCMHQFGADSPLFSPATPLFLDPLPFRPGP